MSLIEVRNVKKSYKGLTIFQDIDLTIEKLYPYVNILP